jgi:hypothetical protein
MTVSGPIAPSEPGLAAAVSVPARQDVSELVRFMRAQPTVTGALGQWCQQKGLGTAPIEARVLSSVSLPGPAPELQSELTAALALEPDMPVRMRHVALVCGSLVLVEAMNWFVPHRLTPGIVHALDTTSVPFGQAVAGLGIRRVDIQDRPPEPGVLFVQQAVVCDRDGQRLAFVIEKFLPALLSQSPAPIA